MSHPSGRGAGPHRSGVPAAVPCKHHRRTRRHRTPLRRRSTRRSEEHVQPLWPSPTVQDATLDRYTAAKTRGTAPATPATTGQISARSAQHEEDHRGRPGVGLLPGRTGSDLRGAAAAPEEKQHQSVARRSRPLRPMSASSATSSSGGAATPRTARTSSSPAAWKWCWPTAACCKHRHGGHSELHQLAGLQVGVRSLRRRALLPGQQRHRHEARDLAHGRPASGRLHALLHQVPQDGDDRRHHQAADVPAPDPDRPQRLRPGQCRLGSGNQLRRRQEEERRLRQQGGNRHPGQAS